MQYNKPKTAAKIMVSDEKKLRQVVLETIKEIAQRVGCTLGPGGRPVLIEDEREGMPPFLTKDGVTVFQHLAYADSVKQLLLETMRSASLRTADQAGDGTTTATILSDAIVREVIAFSEKNPSYSPQQGVRALQRHFQTVLEPAIVGWAKHPKLSKRAGRKQLEAVATLSANGDKELAEAVLEAYLMVGDTGNISINDADGNSSYRVERMRGYTVQSGYESSCKSLWPMFINDRALSRVLLRNPTVILYNGPVYNMVALEPLIEQIVEKVPQGGSRDVIIVAHSFSDMVVGTLGMNAKEGDTLRVVPLCVPRTLDVNGPTELLLDLAALSSALILDPVNNPLNLAQLDQMGTGLELVEVMKDRANFIGHADEDILTDRIIELQEQLEPPRSKLDKILLQGRIGQLTDGIARVTVVGSTPADIRERKDRVDDAVCAVRGAINHGVLPGGGWTLIRLATEKLPTGTTPDDVFLRTVLSQALMAPFRKILENTGLDKECTEQALSSITQSFVTDRPVVFDALKMGHVDPFESGILDSAPAVLEALRSAISIASHLGILGAIITTPRDHELERQEAQANENFHRNVKLGDRLRQEEMSSAVFADGSDEHLD
jgi:chaperonin GroEL